ncbi:hypothetical protein [Azotobacter vinelandii]|uniref:hypothetical protein n=1 Tax=Azotobacter vinelandii TaxID=354 RepID=UPI0026669157|nr:hypothetical protein [Azotobacter vinelandii]WKN21247.1 hypothetical protein AVAEIV_004326 [Azotobacter vinelandii]
MAFRPGDVPHRFGRGAQTLSAGQHLRNSLRRQEHRQNPLVLFKMLIFKPIFLLARLLL